MSGAHVALVIGAAVVVLGAGSCLVCVCVGGDDTPRARVKVTPAPKLIPYRQAGYYIGEFDSPPCAGCAYGDVDKWAVIVVSPGAGYDQVIALGKHLHAQRPKQRFHITTRNLARYTADNDSGWVPLVDCLNDVTTGWCLNPGCSGSICHDDEAVFKGAYVASVEAGQNTPRPSSAPSPATGRKTAPRPTHR